MSLINSWYEVAEGAELRQGSIFRAFPYVKPPKNISFKPDGTPIPTQGKIKVRDVIILTQSCDVVNDKLDLVLVCPVLSLPETDAIAGKTVRHIMTGDGQKEEEVVVKDHPELLAKFREQIRRGSQPALHMLAACFIPAWESEIQVLDFRLAVTVSRAHVTSFAIDKGQHLRVLPPFREHLSQAYARFLMRVGMPSEADIPAFSRLP